jgi:hypothetical protein
VDFGLAVYCDRNDVVDGGKGLNLKGQSIEKPNISIFISGLLFNCIPNLDEYYQYGKA